MLDNYKVIYCTYQKLAAEKRDILSHMVNGVLEESYQEKLKDIKQRMDKLTAAYVYDPSTGLFIEKRDINDPNNPFTGERAKLLSSSAAYALQSYLGKMSEIYDEYFTQEAKFGFEEELEKHLDTINNYEIRYGKGNPELLKHEDYVKSRDWLNANTRYVVSDDLRKMINDAFKVLRENAQGRKILSTIAKRLDAYDNHGIIDLLIENDDEIIVVDYKLKNIEPIYYEEQVRGYCNYIRTITNKKVRGIIYSIIDETEKNI